MGFMSSLVSIGSVTLQSAINSFGQDIILAHTTARRLSELFMMMFGVLGTTMATFCGQNLGAGKTDRVVKGFNSSNVMNVIFSAVVLVLFWTFTSPIVSIFGKDAEVLRIASDGLRITSCFYVFLGLIYTTRNVLNGAGDAMFSLFTGIVECIGRVGFAYPLTLIPFLGSYGVFVATGITWMLNGLFSLIRYKRGKWKTINLVVHKE